MFGNDRKGMRRVFTEAWRKQQTKEIMQPLEQVVANVIRQHPEYHQMLEQKGDILDKEYLPEGGEGNPFLHMSMHISLQEQISTDRPLGISALYRQLLLGRGDAHEVEHQMMECLGRMLWEAQRANRMPDEQAYLECIRKL